MIRETEKYGDVGLSIVAGQFNYCEPRADLPQLDQYESVEVALLIEGRVTMPTLGRLFSDPVILDLPGTLRDLWDGDQVAGYVSHDDLELLRGALRDRASGMSVEDRVNMHAGRVEMLQAVR